MRYKNAAGEYVPVTDSKTSDKERIEQLEQALKDQEDVNGQVILTLIMNDLM
jgi:hypothetical protein